MAKKRLKFPLRPGFPPIHGVNRQPSPSIATAASGNNRYDASSSPRSARAPKPSTNYAIRQRHWLTG